MSSGAELSAERFGFRFGAVIFAAGLTVLGPQAIGIADAETPDGDSSVSAGADRNSGAPQRAKPTAPRTARTGGTVVRADPVPETSVPDVTVEEDLAAELPQRRPSRVSIPEVVASEPSQQPVAPSPAAAVTIQPDQADPVDPADPADPVDPADDPTTPPAQLNAETPTETALLEALPTTVDTADTAEDTAEDTVEDVSVQQAPPAPAQASGPGVHVVRDLVYRFFDVTAAWLAELPPSPGVDMLSGALLLVRRTLFNQAPIVTPVQTTGQAGGPISGRVGAVDPENDPMTYELVQTPLYGDVIVNDDGTYLYTPGADFNGSDVFVVAATDNGRHINLVDLLRPTRTTAVADVDQGPDQNLIEFEFRYGPGSALWSQEALTALRWTAAALSTYFVITTPVTITLDIRGIWVPVKVNPDGTKEGSVLAGASSPLISEDPGFHYTIAQNKIITGIDVNGPAADARVRFNFAHNWAYGDEVAKDQWDFESTAKHELLHAFGFASNTLKAGSNIYPDWGTFDQFLVTKDNVAVIRNYQWDSTYDPNLTGGTTNGLYFAGPNAVAVYGRPVPLYTPTKWLGGSSVSHLDDDTFKDTSGPNVEQLMNSASGAGPGVPILSDIEIAMMRDIGFTMV